MLPQEFKGILAPTKHSVLSKASQSIVCFAGLNKAQCQKTNILTCHKPSGVKFYPTNQQNTNGIQYQPCETMRMQYGLVSWCYKKSTRKFFRVYPDSIWGDTNGQVLIFRLWNTRSCGIVVFSLFPRENSSIQC